MSNYQCKCFLPPLSTSSEILSIPLSIFLPDAHSLRVLLVSPELMTKSERMKWNEKSQDGKQTVISRVQQGFVPLYKQRKLPARKELDEKKNQIPSLSRIWQKRSRLSCSVTSAE
jgi:predicted Fe-S protein YdhL (DUF1289 family)